MLRVVLAVHDGTANGGARSLATRPTSGLGFRCSPRALRSLTISSAQRTDIGVQAQRALNVLEAPRASSSFDALACLPPAGSLACLIWSRDPRWQRRNRVALPLVHPSLRAPTPSQWLTRGQARRGWSHDPPRDAVRRWRMLTHVPSGAARATPALPPSARVPPPRGRRPPHCTLVRHGEVKLWDSDERQSWSPGSLRSDAGPSAACRPYPSLSWSPIGTAYKSPPAFIGLWAVDSLPRLRVEVLSDTAVVLFQ
ncbi:hypothetical protein DFH09DRAFT_1304299 [Mycena vulgaris]|nr:hypothetical protein DFH09DRAFT_1304299 [Mycena vulgaris]